MLTCNLPAHIRVGEAFKNSTKSSARFNDALPAIFRSSRLKGILLKLLLLVPLAAQIVKAVVCLVVRKMDVKMVFMWVAASKSLPSSCHRHTRRGGDLVRRTRSGTAWPKLLPVPGSVAPAKLYTFKLNLTTSTLPHSDNINTAKSASHVVEYLAKQREGPYRLLYPSPWLSFAACSETRR